MDFIRFNCQRCGHQLKIGADKAGRKAKCPKCQGGLVIPSPNQPVGASGVSLMSEEEAITYKLLDEPEPLTPTRDDDEDDEDDDKPKKAPEEDILVKRKARDLASLRKAPTYPEKWEKVRLGLIFVAVGVMFWTASFLLQEMVQFFGLILPHDYSYLAAHQLIDPEYLPEEGSSQPLWRANLYIGLVGGAPLTAVWMWVYRFAFVLTLLQILISGVGYGIAIAVPDRYGTKRLAIAATALAGVTFLITFVFKLLPTCGLGYAMAQLIAPEVAMSPANIERMIPIHVTWSAAPFIEGFFAMLFQMILMAEPILFLCFLRACAKSLQDDVMEKKAHTLIKLGLGLMFIVVSFLLISHAGTSPVLVSLLRLVYLLWTGFTVWMLIAYLLFLFESRRRIERAMKFSG